MVVSRSRATIEASVCSHATTGEETVREPVDFGAGEGASVIEEVTESCGARTARDRDPEWRPRRPALCRRRIIGA